MTSFRRFVAVGIIFFLTTALLYARAQKDEPLYPVSIERTGFNRIPNDLDVLHGVLDNGLTYYVRKNGKPKGFAELELIVRAGSLQEDEDQRGLAHFLEHMLFNGTIKYPKDELLKKLESFGIQIGPDVNAFTKFGTTVYQLTVSTEKGDQFDTGLDILKEWAFNAVLDEEEFEKEREVIHEEWRGRRGAWTRLMDKIYPVIFKDSRYAERLPIGSMDIVLNVPVSAVRRFYKDWYRPDLMAIIAVGDFDPVETVQKIVELFGDQPNPPNARPRVEYPIPDHNETYIKIITDKEMDLAFDWLYVTYNAPSRKYLIDYRKEIASKLFLSMLNKRLDELTISEDPPFIYGYGSLFPFSRGTSFGSLVANVEEDKTLKGMETLLTEAERIRLHGFLQSEFERAKAEYYSNTEQFWNQRNETNSSFFARLYSDSFIHDTPFFSIDWVWKTVQDILPKITLDEVDDFASILLQKTNRSVIITGPQVPKITELRREEINHVVQDVRKKEIAAWEEKLITGQLVDEIPKRGHILTRQTVPGTDIVNLNLSNGAKVYYKVTDYSPNEIRFSSFSPGGTSLASDENFISAKFASRIIPDGGLGKYSNVDIEKLLSGRIAEVSTYILMESQNMSGISSTDDLETQFQLIWLEHTKPRRDDIAWASEINTIKTYLKNRSSDPRTHFMDGIYKVLYEDQFRMQPDKLESLEKFNIENAYDFYKNRFRYGGNFTYIFVGDFEPAVLEALCEKWLAGLPKAPFPETWRDNQVRMSQKSQDITVIAGSEPVSYVNQSWGGVWDGSYEEEYKLNSLASALEIRLFEVLREDFGGTYTVFVNAGMKRIPVPEYRFMIDYGCDPERVEELSAKVLEIIDEWRTIPPDSRISDSIVMNQRNNLKRNMESNIWWVSQIEEVLKSGLDYTILLDLPSLYDTMNPDVLIDTASRYLNADTYSQVVLLPEVGGGEEGEDEN